MLQGLKTTVCLTSFNLSGAFKRKLHWIGLFIIRFQGVTGAQDYTNILVFSSKDISGMYMFSGLSSALMSDFYPYSEAVTTQLNRKTAINVMFLQ